MFDAVLVISFGGPQGVADIRPFLANVLRGRRVSPERVEEVAHHYEMFSGVSPITALTLRQAEGLQQRLAVSGTPLPVFVGMRNWHPYLADTLRTMYDAGHRRAIGFITAARAELRATRGGDIEVTFVGSWFDHPLFIEANAQHVGQARARLGLPLGLAPALVAAQSPTTYRLSFPEPEHRWMQVEATFTDLPPAPLDLHMSRSSPGRYSLHEFAKNVWAVEVTDSSGAPLDVERPSPSRWLVPRHGATVRVRYRVFGDRADGTYLGIDSTHAHINMPAAILWAAGFDDRPIALTFEPPQGLGWQAATQLFPTTTAFSYTAPNLQYLMDSPAELSAFTMRQFTVPDGGRTPIFRVAVHHAGSSDDVDAYARNVEAIVREARAVFGEFALGRGAGKGEGPLRVAERAFGQPSGGR